MLSKIRNAFIRRSPNYLAEGQQLRALVEENISLFDNNSIFVESGCGVSTPELANVVNRLGAKAYSCDLNQSKVDALKSQTGDQLNNIEFLVGDSLESFKKIRDKHDQINFTFLDSAASAMHTFNEFKLFEDRFKPGSMILIDNASLPCSKVMLSPVRKGKILVPYLMSSPFWEVIPFHSSGGSMVAAILRQDGIFADETLEDPDYIDEWKKRFGTAYR
ncbi:MAG: class I SAM-dependent methyltransferase [Bacteroidia bacterium]|nr:class I SAM-dependent methyltransferase [Bacteroidia bacterium]